MGTIPSAFLHFDGVLRGDWQGILIYTNDILMRLLLQVKEDLQYSFPDEIQLVPAADET